MTSAEEAARAALEDIHWGDGEENIKKITALILSREAEARKQEREECVEIATKYIGYRSPIGPQHGAGCEQAARNIIAAIRARSGA